MDLRDMLFQFAMMQGRETLSDTPDNPLAYSTDLERFNDLVAPRGDWEIMENEEDERQKLRLHQLYQFMQQHPQHRQSLQDLYYRGERQNLDQSSHNRIWGRKFRENDKRLQEMRYLPTGDWQQMNPPMRVPLPRRM